MENEKHYRPETHWRKAWLLVTLTLLTVLACMTSTAESSETVSNTTTEDIVLPDNCTPDILQNSQYIFSIYAKKLDSNSCFFVEEQDDDPLLVINEEGVLTQSSEASRKLGSIGLFAHYGKLGYRFYDLQIGDEMIVVLKDGSQKAFAVSEIHMFQALEPHNPRGSFVPINQDLEPIGPSKSSDQTFRDMFRREDLTLQTCIPSDGNSSWGRYFVIAEPVGIR